MTRTFVAIRLPDKVIEELGRLSRELRSAPGGQAGRWVDPWNIHLTIKFLGQVEEERISLICDAVERACSGVAPIGLELGELGCFPNPRRPRVLWVAVAGQTEALASLHGRINAALGDLGYQPDSRRFSPHLTLARVRRNASRDQAARLGELATEPEAVPQCAFFADAVHVIKSELGRGGPHYTDLHAIRFVRPGMGQQHWRTSS